MVLAALVPVALAGEPAAAVRARIEALLAEHAERVQIGLEARDLESGEVWVSQDADEPLKPASVLKLFVTAAALHRFGPDFAYSTRLYLLDDDLIVVGSGDPGLGDERIAKRLGRPVHWEFDFWARRLREGLEDRPTGDGRDQGKKVRSHEVRTIALDDGIFEPPGRHPDWPAQQEQEWYQAPVGGINFNDNCLDVHVAVGDDAGLRLTLRPPLPDSFVRNLARRGAEQTVRAYRAGGGDVFTIEGTVARDDDLRPVSVRRPSVFFGHALQAALQERGVAVTGSVVRRHVTAEMLSRADLLCVNRTTLRDVLWRANTFSQNLFAECLLKSLAAYEPDGTRSGRAGSWESGRAVLQETLAEIGVETRRAVFRDGSGLSHENRVTASQVVQLLRTMAEHPHASLFLGTLARPGEAGTMRKRPDDPALVGRLRGKTGTISGVRALAGIIERDDGHTLVFAVLGNGRSPSEPVHAAVHILATAGSVE